MSGVFGAVNAEGQEGIGALAQEMARVMSHREWYVSDCLVDERRAVAIGRMGIGIFNRGAQPVWNGDVKVCFTVSLGERSR